MPETEEVREMRTAETVLNIIRDRGQRGLPVERLYRQLYNRDLYLRAYGKIYRNAGAMTPGLRVPKRVIDKHCAKYMRYGKPWHLMQRTIDSTYSIVAQYQAEYQGVVQYYRLAYNLHQCSRLHWVMQTSLARTLAKKLKISTAQVYQRFRATHQNEYGTYKVLKVVVERESGKAPLVAHFGGIPLRHNKWAAINDTPPKPIWSGRSEVVDRLLAQQCELCGATGNVEVHHIRKLADLKCYGQTHPPQWVQTMAARRRKTLVVCQDCHNAIQYGRYDGAKFSK
jgi:hypothetical protein